jgi:hypothetical protein
LQLARDSIRALHAIFAVYPNSTCPSGHAIPFLLAGTLVIFSVVIFLALSLRPFWLNSDVDGWVIFYSSVAALVLGILATVFSALIIRSFHAKVLPRRRKGTKPVSSATEYWLITIPEAVLAGAICAVFLGIVLHTDYLTGYFFAYRTLLLTSGVSPLTPILILSAGYFYWAWIHMRREGWIAARRELHTQAPEDAQAHINRVNEALENIFSKHVWRPALLFIVLWLVIAEPWSTFRTIEPRSYDFIYCLEFGVFYWMMALCWTQFIWSWKHFRVFLQWLERNPIRNAFSRLQKEITWVPLVSRLREHSLFISTRCWDALRALCGFQLPPDPGNSRREHHIRRLATLQEQIKPLADEVDVLGKTLECRIAKNEIIDGSPEYADLQRRLDDVARIVLQDLEEHEWKGDSDSIRREEALEKAKELTPEKRLIILKEEFVAYRYLVYMRYVFRQLSNLLGFVVAAFILSIISLQSYPFQGHRWIVFSSFYVFAALGVWIAIVFAQIDRDAVLSRLTDTNRNELGKTFFFRLAQYGALPLITVLATQFPWVNRLFFSWVRPALDILH